MEEEKIIKELCNNLDGNMETNTFCVVKLGKNTEMQIRKGISGIWIGFYNKAIEKDIYGNKISYISSGGIFDQRYGGKFDKIDCEKGNITMCKLEGKEENVLVIKDKENNKEEISVIASHKGVGIADFHLTKEE